MFTQLMPSGHWIFVTLNIYQTSRRNNNNNNNNNNYSYIKAIIIIIIMLFRRELLPLVSALKHTHYFDGLRVKDYKLV